MLQLLAMVGIASLATRARASAAIVVIVNPTNPIRALGPGELEAIFTTRKLDWPGGARVVPFNFPARDPVREAFDRSALHFDADEAARYWIDRRVRGGHPPPRQVPDARTMLRVVASLDAAVGYLPGGVADGTVKIVAEL